MTTSTLELNDVGVTYPNGHTALTGISGSLKAGNICALVGVNGAGKSTLFRAMMGLVQPSTGSIRIAGLSTKSALKQNLVAYVPQTEEVDWNFPILVRDVVMMGRYGHMGFFRRPAKEDLEQVEQSLERVGMIDFQHRQIGELSGGQKKRVFVARALAQNGPIILLDEPFTGVDIQTEDSIIQLLSTFAQEGRLVVVSTHNLGSVPTYCDEVMLINQTLIAHGPVSTTFTQHNLVQTFGSMLRSHQIVGQALHKDADGRGVTVLTDDERPLVFYGDDDHQEIAKS